MNKLNKHLSKIFILCLSLGVLLFAGSCNSWMSNDDFMSKIESEVHDANASAIQVYVRYANSKMGTSEPSGYTTMKVDVAAELSAVTSDDYGFVKWAAFSTNDFPTSQQHSNLFYETAEKYEENFKPLELPESEVFFSNPTEPTTTVKIYKERNDVFIIPVVAKRPTIVTSVPTNGSSDVVRNTSIRILFSKEMDPASFADEFGNSNIVVTSGSAVLTEAAGDLSAKDITANLNISLGKTGKMLTIAPKSGYYFDNNSQITVNIYEEVCDTDGFELNGKISFSFTTGVKLDSLAPRIEEIYASPTADFSKENRFEQYYYLLQGEAEPVFKTQIDAATNTLQDFVDFDAKNWETDPSKPAKYKKPILKQRVTRYLNIYVRANDIAGSGGNVVLNNNTLSESSVAAIQIRACLYVNASGDPVTTSATAFKDNSNVSSDYYLEPIQIGYAPGLKDSECKIQNTFENVMGDSVTGGTLFTYDLEGLPDGLIKIDIWAVDMVGNSGDTESYVKQEYNNNYRSIFVVKDTQAPSAALAKSKITITSQNIPYNWYNSVALSNMKIQDTTANLIKDLNNVYLSSNINDLMWAFKLGNDTSWQPSANAANTWSAIHIAGEPSIKAMSDAVVSSDGPVYITMCLKDDLGNVSDSVVLDAINYDNTAPVVPATVGWVKEKLDDNGNPTGTFEDVVATTNESLLSNSGHVLKIPFTEKWAGIRQMKLTVTERGTPNTIEQSGYSVYYVPESGTASTLSFTTDSNKIIYFSNVDSSIKSGTFYIKGIKIGNNTGAYDINVELWDSSLNKSTTTSSISIDTTSPVIKRIYIPGLKKSVTPAQTTSGSDSTEAADGWFLPHEYVLGSNVNTSAEHSKPGYIPLYLFIQEEHSGVKKIEFASGSSNSVELFKSAAEDGSHGETKLYLVSNCGQPNESKTAISGSDYKVESSTIIFNDDKCVSATGDFVLLLDNVGFKNITTDLEKVNVTVTDLANLVGSKNEISTSVNGNTVISGIKVDSYMNASATTYLLEDRQTEADCREAQTGYTNETTVNLKITFDDDYIKVDNVESASSGYNKIKIVSGASIDANTKIYYGTKELPYQVNSDGSITLRKKEGQNFTDYYVIRGNDPIVIKDLKLNSNTEDTIKVKIKTYDLAGWENSETETTIVYDKTKPVWKGKGLYSAAESRVNSDNVYPHSGNSNAEDKTPYYGITFNGSDDLYFYKNLAGTFIRIEPDLTEKNYHKVHWGTAGDAEYFYYSTKGTYTVYAYDKAGNKSSELTFKLVDINTLRAGIASLEHNAELIMPSGYTKEKNTWLNLYRSDMPWKQNTYVYWGSQKNDKIKVMNYVLRKAPNGSNYQLKINVAPYVDISEDYAPVESYGITTVYSHFPSTGTNYSQEPFEPNIDTVAWNDYKKNSTTNTDYQIDSKVDNDGCIVLTLPNHDLPPISLFLKDGVGNTTYVILNPDLQAKLGRDRETYESVGWLMDEEVGSVVNSTNYNDVSAVTFNNISSDYMNKPGSDVIFYKLDSSNLSTYVKFGGDNGFSDMCRFDIDSSTIGSAEAYSMRSRIMAWTGDGKPSQTNFENATTEASEWYYYKEKLDSGSFNLQNNLPQYDSVDNQGYGVPYKLYYIIEDRVGNCEIKQLVKGNSNEKWLYDNTPPTLSVSNAQKVNYIDDDPTDNEPGVNYYSDNSYLVYSISDKMSGIMDNGTTDDPIPDYTNFGARKTSYIPSEGFSLNGKKPKDQSDNECEDGVPGTLAVSNVKDWARNKVEDQGLENSNSTSWVRLSAAPVLSDIASNTATIKDKDEKTYGASSYITKLERNWSGNYAIHKITSKKGNKKITVELMTTDSIPLLGWVVTKDPSNTTFEDFYSVGDSKLSSEVVYDDVHKVWTYVFNKGDITTAWDSKFSGSWYFYPVNRAGKISGKAVCITFGNNPEPGIKSGTLTYTNDVVPYETISGGKVTSAINFFKSTSKIQFTTIEKPNSWVLLDEQDTSLDSGTISTSTDEQQVTITLSKNTLATETFKDKQLILKLSTGLEDAFITLNGPNSSSYDKNTVVTWAYDQTPPSISLASVKTQGTNSNKLALQNVFNTSDKAYYIEGDNAIIEFSTSDTDIAKWQKKLDSELETAYTDITNFDTTNKTLTLASTNNKYNFRAVDKAGNASSAVTVEIKKDVSVPLVNSFSYELRKGETKAADGTYTDNSETIVYNKTEVNKIYLNLTDISDPDGNGLHFFNNDSSLSTTTSNGVTYATISLSLTDGASATYAITVKDDVGKSKDIKTFTVKADDSTPEISISSVQSKTSGGTYDGYLSSGVYYLCRKNAIITLSSEAQDIAQYQVNINDAGWNDITPENGVYTFSCEGITTATTYAFHAIDNVGHVSSSVSATIVYDGAAPTGSVTHTVKTSSGTATEADPAANPIVIGDYTASGPDADGVITITYNSNVKTIVFNDSGVSDEGAGYTSGTLFYKKGSNGSATEITNKTLSLEDDMGTDIYEIIAKDNTTGNSGTVGKYKFVKDTTGPEINTGVTTVNWHDREIKQVNGYTSTIGTIPYAKWVSKDQRKRASYYTSGTKLMFAKTAIPGAVQYQMVQTVTTGNTKETDGYTATAGNTWQNMVVSDDGNNFVFALPDIHTPYTRLSLFFRDELGNVSDAYYLGNNTSGQQGIQWWIIGGAISAGDTTITSITWNNNGTVTNGWGGKLHDYTVTLTLPVGTLIKSVFLVPKPGNANTGVVFSTSLPQGVNTSLQFSGYGTETDVVTVNGNKEGIKDNYDSEGFLVLPSSSGSTTGTITMIIYPHDVEDADKGNILVKFNADSIDATNGISGAIFGDSPTFNIVNTGISLLQDIMLAGASEKMEKSVSPSISRIQNYWSPVTYNTQASVNFIEENNPIKAAQTIAETVAAKQTAKQKTETSAKPKAKTKAKTKTKAKAKAEAKAEELVQTMPEMVQDVIEQIEEITPDAGINPVEPAAITAVQGNSELKTTEATTTEPSTKSTTTIILVILALCIAITGIVVGCKKRKILV